MVSWVVALVLTLPVFLPDSLLGQAVHEGKWRVTAANPEKTLYVNLNGQSQKLLFTVCSVSGGNAEWDLGSSIVVSLATGDCVTLGDTIGVFENARIRLASGTSASGTYSVSIVP
jgi:hypothetical protein